MAVRRVVTGHSPDGKAIFVDDGEVAPTRIRGRSELFHIWAADDAPTFPDDGSPASVTAYWPPVGGYRFLMMSVAPSGEATTPETSAPPPSDSELTGLGDAFRPGDLPGMHASDTVDLEMVISGHITLELDDGTTRTMGPGDAIIQNGTHHRWLNHGTEPANVAVILLGAHRA
jgi:quercetin dioxygenase-like cupin family protein